MIILFKRLLIQFTTEIEIDHLIRCAKAIKREYPEVEVAGLYVKDLEKYSIPSIPLHGEVLKTQLDQWKILEDKREKKIRETFKSLMPNCAFYSKSGNVTDVVLNELRLFDLLLLSKPEKISIEIKELLRNHHKPILLVPPQDDYFFDKILVADDQRLEVNKAFFNFINMFTKVDEFKAVTVNAKNKDVVDLNDYLSKIDKKMLYEFKKGHIDEVITDYLKDYDLLIMGELKHSIAFERLVGRAGLKLLEKASKIIFIS